MNHSQFKLAGELLKLIVQHAQTLALADLRQKDLTRTRQAVLELRTVASRLREELHHIMPALRRTCPELQPENHSQQLVHGLLDLIAQHYADAMTLQQCAANLRVSIPYLSHLFSSAVGMTFKAYLTEVRVEKARELLSDPTQSISEVAFAVGYSSENCFRVAFRKATGLSPRAWREALQMPRQQPAAPVQLGR